MHRGADTAVGGQQFSALRHAAGSRVARYAWRATVRAAPTSRAGGGRARKLHGGKRTSLSLVGHGRPAARATTAARGVSGRCVACARGCASRALRAVAGVEGSAWREGSARTAQSRQHAKAPRRAHSGSRIRPSTRTCLRRDCALERRASDGKGQQERQGFGSPTGAPPSPSPSSTRRPTAPGVSGCGKRSDATQRSRR